MPAQPGPIQTSDGQTVGRHDGLMYYTLGQRKGIQIGGLAGRLEQPWYVVAKHLGENSLIIAQGDEHSMHFSTQLTAHTLNWIAPVQESVFRCWAKTRYRQPDQACQVQIRDNEVLVTFDEPQRAVTPGQSVVFYQHQRCLGGGIISATNSPGGLLPSTFAPFKF